MARNEIEGLILLLDVGSSMTTKMSNSSSSYLQSCVDTIQMIVQRKMFQTSKDELALILFGSNETGNVLWDGSSDQYRHVFVARPLSITDWLFLDFIQNKIAATNIDGDVLDGLVIASNHYQEDLNRTKSFKSKRIILFTDFSSGSSSDDDEIKSICSGLAKHSIRVDIISPFSDEDIERSQNAGNRGNDVGGDRARSSRDAGADETKTMTREQMKTQALLQQICEKTEGAMFSFDEALTLLSHYQSKAIKSMGTKFVLTIGENFKMPIVSMIKCKENKPDLFKFKKVYAKDENVELKIDRARFTKDDEQRDLDDKTDVVDAFKYGSTYVPIDNDSDTLKLKVEKCFSMLGFTKSENVKRYYYLGDSVNQIVPDAAAGEECEEAFVNMVHAMYVEGVYGLVRKVFSSRSSPELGCLIPHISKETTCLYYVSLPFEDDIRKFTLENFSLMKKFKPKESQLKLVDELIDAMDLDNDEDNEDEEEPYDPHVTFNPYIQRMFQSIAMRATNPSSELPDFDSHITSTHLARIGARVRTEKTEDILKRMREEFPTRLIAKKTKKADEASIFEKKKETDDDKENSLLDGAKAVGLNGDKSDDDLQMICSSNNLNKVKKIGTVTPVQDFKYLAERIVADARQDDFEDLCIQMQILVKDLFKESLQQASNDDDTSVKLFQRKSVDSIRVMREYCIRMNAAEFFNSYLKAFKVYLLNESKTKRNTSNVEFYWKTYFVEESLSLISKEEVSNVGVEVEDAKGFLESFNEANKDSGKVQKQDNGDEENVEDLLDMM